MIPDKVKALFQFIEYLHSNIENFNQYNGLIKELEILRNERQKLKRNNNYNDKRQYDKVQAEFGNKFDVLQENIANLIKAKAIELNVCSFDNSPIYRFNGVEAEMHELKKNFNDTDLPEIFKHKSKYLEYRTKTHKSFWSLEMFFVDLDRLLKEFFEFFSDNKAETDVLQETVIKVENFKEVALYINKGITLTDFIKENKEKAFAFDLQKAQPLAYYELQKQKLNPDREFIKKAIEQTKNSLTNCLVNNNHKGTYKNHTPPYLIDVRLYLEYSKLLEPQQIEKLDEVLSLQITHPKSIEIAKAIKGKYSSYKGKDFKILYEALLQLDLFPKKGKRSVFFRCLQNEWIGRTKLTPL